MVISTNEILTHARSQEVDDAGGATSGDDDIEEDIRPIGLSMTPSDIVVLKFAESHGTSGGHFR